MKHFKKLLLFLIICFLSNTISNCQVPKDKSSFFKFSVLFEHIPIPVLFDQQDLKGLVSKGDSLTRINYYLINDLLCNNFQTISLEDTTNTVFYALGQLPDYFEITPFIVAIHNYKTNSIQCVLCLFSLEGLCLNVDFIAHSPNTPYEIGFSDCIVLENLQVIQRYYSEKNKLIDNCGFKNLRYYWYDKERKSRDLEDTQNYGAF